MRWSLGAPIIFPLLTFGQTTIIATQIVTVSPSSPPSSQYTSDADFQSSILNSTNFFRTEHNTTALTWNDSLATYASHYADNRQWQHSAGPNGENLAQGFADITSAVEAWGDERSTYDFNNPGFCEETGHFTQLVWKATTSVGCGRTFCNGTNDVGGWYLVCEYYPPGNVFGAFGAEVGPATNSGGQCDHSAGCMNAASMREVPRGCLLLVALSLALYEMTYVQ